MLSRMCNFYPRPPRGGRLIYQATTEDDRKFLSTPSARRATLFTTTKASLITISIHALREEGDSGCRFCSCRTFYFYPRPPRGGRRPCGQCVVIVGVISIHALREEGDGDES